MPPRKNDERTPLPLVRVAPLGELHVFQISDGELTQIENGPPSQLHLNFALAMLPTALSLAISLQTATFPDGWRNAYQIAAWLLGIQGLYSLVRWWNGSKDFNKLIKDIRGRMPDKPGIPEQLTLPVATDE